MPYELTFSGYTDFYYSSFNNTTIDDFQPLTTVGSIPGFKNNISTFGINLETQNFRGQFTTHSGRIVGATWDSELPGIQEAYLGVHLFKDFYIDAGYFITHIGMESFMPKENLLSSTSIITYNEPFYQRGIRAEYGGIKNVDIQLWLLDGYNLFRDNNESKSIGLLISYEKDNFSASYSNIIGQELNVFDENSLRTYHNAYITYEFYKNIFELNTSLDFATQAPTSNISSQFMLSYITTLRVNITKRLSGTIRYESQNDQDGILNSQVTPSKVVGLNMYGVTYGIGYEKENRYYFRYEMRNLQPRENSINPFNLTGGRTEHLLTAGIMFEAKISKKQTKK